MFELYALILTIVVVCANTVVVLVAISRVRKNITAQIRVLGNALDKQYFRLEIIKDTTNKTNQYITGFDAKYVKEAKV